MFANCREMRESLLIGFHAVAFVLFAFAVYYDFTYTVVPRNVMKVHGAFGGKFKFLTFWDAVSITYYNTYVFLHNWKDTIVICLICKVVIVDLHVNVWNVLLIICVKFTRTLMLYYVLLRYLTLSTYLCTWSRVKRMCSLN